MTRSTHRVSTLTLALQNSTAGLASRDPETRPPDGDMSRGPRPRNRDHPPNPAPRQTPGIKKPARQQPGSSRTWTACGECSGYHLPLLSPVWTLDWRRPLAPRSSLPGGSGQNSQRPTWGRDASRLLVLGSSLRGVALGS